MPDRDYPKKWTGRLTSPPGRRWRNYEAERGDFDSADTGSLASVLMYVDKQGNGKAYIAMPRDIDEVDISLLLDDLEDFLIDKLEAELDDELEEDCEELDDDCVEDDYVEDDYVEDCVDDGDVDEEAMAKVFARFMNVLVRALRRDGER